MSSAQLLLNKCQWLLLNDCVMSLLWYILALCSKENTNDTNIMNNQTLLKVSLNECSFAG